MPPAPAPGEVRVRAPRLSRADVLQAADAFPLAIREVILSRPLKGATGRIVYRFHARDVNLIMGASAGGTSVRFRVRIDGKPPGGAQGTDVDEEGYGVVSEPRMYQLIRQPGPVADRVFEIEFFGPGVDAFDFTFG